MEPSNSITPRVNGNMLSSYINKQVCLVAELHSLEGAKMKIKCCDGPIILAQLTESISQNLEANTKIQVIAIPKSKNTIQCVDFIVLPDDANDFNVDLYNEAVKMYAQNVDTNTYLVNDIMEHWGSTNEKEIELVEQPESTQNKQNGDMSQSNKDMDTFG